MLAQRLSPRDCAVLLDLARVRVLSGSQLTRLHFSELAPDSGERTRRRVLARLAEQRLVATLDRAVGGARSGSAGHVYALGIAAPRVLPLLGSDAYEARRAPRSRSPVTPGTLFLSHAFDVAERYVELRERERTDALTLVQFLTESAAWWSDSRGGIIKPDAYVCLRSGRIEDHWWIEVDRATESIPTLRLKLLAYLDFARSGQPSPGGVTPRVLITVPHERRLAAVRELVAHLPFPAAELTTVALQDQATAILVSTLQG